MLTHPLFPFFILGLQLQNIKIYIPDKRCQLKATDLISIFLDILFFFPGKVPHLKVNKSQCETDISFFISCLKGLFPLIWQDTPKLGLITFLSYLLRRGFLVPTLFHCIWSSSLAYYLWLLPPCTVMQKTPLFPGGSVLIG